MAKKTSGFSIVEVYGPGNGANLTEEQLAHLPELTSEEIAELAKAYPNGPTQRAYLHLRDTSKKDNQQTFPLSTWQNLNSLRRLGQNNLVVAGYKGILNVKTKLSVAPVQDISADKAKSILKTAGTQKVEETDLETGEDLEDNESFEDLSKEAADMARAKETRAAAAKPGKAVSSAKGKAAAKGKAGKK